MQPLSSCAGFDDNSIIDVKFGYIRNHRDHRQLDTLSLSQLCDSARFQVAIAQQIQQLGMQQQYHQVES